MKNRMTNEEVVRITSEKLCSNDDWRDAYERYAKAITSKKIQFDEAAKFLKKTFQFYICFFLLKFQSHVFLLEEELQSFYMYKKL